MLLGVEARRSSTTSTCCGPPCGGLWRLEGYGVTDAASGEEAIELLKERSWDAMVLDVLMPGISGVEVCERLRAAGERIPILILDCTRDRRRPGTLAWRPGPTTTWSSPLPWRSCWRGRRHCGAQNLRR